MRVVWGLAKGESKEHYREEGGNEALEGGECCGTVEGGRKGGKEKKLEAEEVSPPRAPRPLQPSNIQAKAPPAWGAAAGRHQS